MNALSLDSVSVFCGIPYLGIEKLECREAVNEHTAIYIKLWIPLAAVAWLERHSLCNQKIKIQLGRENEELVNLCGDIVSAEWGTAGERLYADIHAVSATKRLDIHPEKAFFQQSDVTYGTILKSRAAQYNGTCLLMDGKEEITEHPVVQYLETDWALIKRIAARLNSVIIVNSGQEIPRFSIGCIMGKEYTLGDVIKVQKVINLRGHGFFVRTWENYRMGDRISAYGENLTVFEKVTSLKNGLIEYAYHLGNKKSYILTEKENEMLRGVSVRGKVLEVRDERIKLNLGTDGGASTARLYSYRYLPVTGNIMYSMPEVGTEAELYFPSPDVKEAYVRNCFLPDSDYPGSSVKYMKTLHQKVLEMNPDGILWQAESAGEDVQSINLRRTSGVTFRGSETVSLTAAHNIMFQAGASCSINTMGIISLEQTETVNHIQISGNGVKMCGEYYSVSSDSPKGVRKETSEGSPDMSEANQCILAALPMKECDSMTMQIVAAIPQILSADSLKKPRMGYFR